MINHDKSVANSERDFGRMNLRACLCPLNHSAESLFINKMSTASDELKGTAEASQTLLALMVMH